MSANEQLLQQGIRGRPNSASGPLRRVLAVLLLGIAPIVFLTTLALLWHARGDLGLDFHHELYPQASKLLGGKSPYPSSADVAFQRSGNAIWPVAALLPVAPLTLVPVGVAAVLMIIVSITALAGALRLLGVRDWRIYGATLLWPGTVAAVQTANPTLILCLLLAIAVRPKSTERAAGLALGAAIAVKFFLWPVAVYLLSVRRVRAAAIAAVVAVASVALILPFASLGLYVRLVRRLVDTFATRSYTPYGFLIDTGASHALARVVALGVGAALLWLAYKRRSVRWSVAAALALSPLVWLHFLVLLAVPLALARPRFGWAWLVPLVIWVSPGQDSNGSAWQSALVLVVAATMLALATELRAPALQSVTGSAEV